MFGGFDRMFQDMNQQMADMDRRMSEQMSAIGGDFFGDGALAQRRGRQNSGSMLSFPFPSMGDMPSGGGSMSSMSFSSSSVSTRGPNGQPQTIQYSSSSRKSAQPGMETVTETRRNYRDSNGVEKIGVARTVGNRGRNLVRMRDASGQENSKDDLMNVSDPAAFDTEWERAASSSRFNQQPHLGLGSAPPRGLLGGGAGYSGHNPAAHSAEERRAARQGREEYDRQRSNLLREAHAARDHDQIAPPRNLSRPGSVAVPPRSAASSHRSQHSSYSNRSNGGLGTNTRLARQMAGEEEDRLWRNR